MATQEQWVDMEDVSQHLKVNKETIRRWIKTQDFPAHKAGNLLRFKLSEVDAWVRQGDPSEDSRNQSNAEEEQ